MPRFVPPVLAVAILLSGCSSLGGLTSAPGAPDASVLSGDLSRTLFALDVPVTVEPIPPGPRLIVTLPGSPGLEAILVRADAEPVMAVLPPPREGRTYYVYALATADRAAIASLQGRLAAAAAPVATVAIAPALCITSGVDPARERISVLPVLDGRALPPLLADESLATLATRSGIATPPCEGHSG